MNQFENYDPPKTPPKERIHDAYWNLMKDKPIDRISVDELAEKSGISRRTFYRHFSSAEAVLEHIYEGRINFFISHYEKRAAANFKSFLSACFEHWNFWDKQFLYILKDNGRLYHYLEHFVAQTQDLLAEPFKNPDERSQYEAYVPPFIIGGLCGILVKWLEDGATIHPKDMYQVASRIIKSDALIKPNPQQRS